MFTIPEDQTDIPTIADGGKLKVATDEREGEHGFTLAIGTKSGGRWCMIDELGATLLRDRLDAWLERRFEETRP